MQGIRVEFMVDAWSGDENGFIQQDVILYGRGPGATFEVTFPWNGELTGPEDEYVKVTEKAEITAWRELDERGIQVNKIILISITPTTIDDIENPVDFSRFDFLDD